MKLAEPVPAAIITPFIVENGHRFRKKFLALTIIPRLLSMICHFAGFKPAVGVNRLLRNIGQDGTHSLRPTEYLWQVHRMPIDRH